MTKKETQMLNREKVKLADQHRGIKDMRRLPDALVIVAAQYEDTAIREASRLEIPVIAIVDSNTNPNKTKMIVKRVCKLKYMCIICLLYTSPSPRD